MTILDEIVKNKALEIQVAKQKLPLDNLVELVKKVSYNPVKLDCSKFFLISEIKPKSPSSGQIIPESQDIIKLCKDYEKLGTSAFSVLTDFDYFGGSLELLTQIREHTQLPILRKEFIIDPYQIWETKLYKADLILLIVKILSKQSLTELLNLSLELELQSIIEINDISELELAKSVIKESDLDVSKLIFGINNRNLSTFTVDLQNSMDLMSQLPAKSIKMALSGIKHLSDLKLMQESGFNGCLIGEGLYKNPELFNFFKPKFHQQVLDNNR
jgi:indole-3-glycerol phosphate synthase